MEWTAGVVMADSGLSVGAKDIMPSKSVMVDVI